jgi:hypothetical protein
MFGAINTQDVREILIGEGKLDSCSMMKADALFRFHFPASIDNSGSVGWLATILKTELGTGVFVTCGSNRLDGGIFDYWGIPDALRERGFAVVRQLCGIQEA